MTAPDSAILARLTRAGIAIDIAADDIEKALAPVQSPDGTSPFDDALQFIEHATGRVVDLVYLWNEYGQVRPPRPITIGSVKHQRLTAVARKTAA